MARQPRTTSPSGWYHLVNRGADRQDTFSQEADYVHFERLLGEASERVGVEIHAYCLMTNHFHLVVHAPNGDVSQFMHDVSGAYSLGYNRRNDRRGPLFEGRYRSIGVSSDRQLGALGRYVHRNPLSLGPIAVLGSYRWSSLAVYLGARCDPSWLTTGTLDDGRSPDQYRAFVEMDLPHDRIDPTKWALSMSPSLDDVESLVADCAAVERAGLFAPAGPRTIEARTMSVMLAVELRLAGATELAQRYGFGSPNAVRTMARRGRVRVATDPSFGRLRARILESLRV